MENGFASARADAFPAGLRVLVVDDDITWLKVLEKMLKKCSYEVTTCCLAIDALNILRERKDGFDIVISDVNMPDMDGFKLLEHVGLEMDLPVIMMSVDGETSRVMKGVQHGACDYLLKPVRMKELKNIWQHVFRKKIHEVKDIESHEVNEDIPSILKQGSEKFEDGYLLSGGILNLAKKRKDTENKEHDNNQDLSDPSSAKKARVVWTVDLHQKFVNAVNQIGIDKVGPKKILDLMNIPWLTRENVASHLQKYRLYLSRLEKESEPQACFVGLKQTDYTPKDPSARFGLQCSIIIHQNSTPCSTFGYSSGETLVQPMDPKIGEDDLKGIIPVLPVPETRNALNTNLHENPKRSNGSQIDFTGSVGTLNCASFDSSTRSQKHQWNGEIGDVQFKQQTEPKNKLYVHTHPLLAAPSINAVASIAENNKSNSTGTNPLSNGHRSNHATHISAMGSTTGSYPIQTETGIANIQASGPGCAISESSSVKGYCFDHNSVSTWESEQKNLIGGTGTVLQSAENLHLCSLQDYGYIENTVLNSIEFLDYHDLELFAAVPNQSCERMKLNCDYLYESVDYPVMDQGLFIA